MKRFVPFALAVFASSSALAVEEVFLGDSVTVLASPLTTQPAGLAWQPENWNLSASATSLQQTYQDVRGVSGFRPSNTPLKFVPVHIASGKGNGSSGWGFDLKSNTFEFRTLGETGDGTTTSKSDVLVQNDSVTASAGFGLKLASQWSVGANLNVSQMDINRATKTRSILAANAFYQDIEETSQTVFGTAGFGILFEAENLRWGLTAVTPSERLTHRGSRDTVIVNTATDQILESSASVPAFSVNQWTFATGVRLRLADFGFLHLRDGYLSSGRHTPAAGLQMPTRWGTFLGSFSATTDAGREYRLTAGLMQSSKTYDWGIGPSYTDSRGSETGSISTRTIGLLFSSEIRF